MVMCLEKCKLEDWQKQLWIFSQKEREGKEEQERMAELEEKTKSSPW